MVGDAEVDAVKSFTQVWMGWLLRGKTKNHGAAGGWGPAGISYNMQQTNPVHFYLNFVRYFTKLLTVK